MQIQQYFFPATLALTLSFSQRGLAMENMEIDLPDLHPISIASIPSGFPIDMLAHIFSFLDQRDLLRAGGICKKWRQAAEKAWKRKPLDLSKRSLRQADYKALAQGIFPSLILQEVQLGPEVACILALCSRLTKLDLLRNSMGDEGAKTIAFGNPLKLTNLNLDGNSLGDEGAKILAAGNLSALTNLNLNYSSIGNEGIKALAHGNLSALTMLNLRNNSIGDEGVKAFASGNLSALTILDLSGNDIGDEGAQAIANGNFSALTTLDLRYNSIGDEGKEVLKKSTRLTRLII